MDIKTFVCQRSAVFAELDKLREEIWQNSSADVFFQRQQNNSDNATPELKRKFFEVMRNIAKEINGATQFINDIEVRRNNGRRAPPPRVLDLCMAPGGFSEEVRQSLSPLSEFNGITLPRKLGGHNLLLEHSTRLNVQFLDITMLAGEMGFEMTDIPLDHPDRDLFRFDRPFLDQKYDLILCDGQVLRTHKREEYREKTEAMRLSVSQLVFALQHMKKGGSFVMLLHNADASHIFNLIYKFRQISASIQVFKPTKYHTIRSSFYLVAKGVNPHCVDAKQAVNEWKEIWASCTIHRCGEVPPISDENIREILFDFGVEFIELCEPMWKIQVDALSRKLRSGFDNSFRF